MVQQHQSSNSKLEDSTVNTSKTVSYMPGSALCAESTYNTILLKFGALLAFLDPAGQGVGLRSCSKTVLGPNHIEYQLQISKESTFFCFHFGPIWGPFCPFWALMGYIWG